jgi:hypothetical protein
MADKLLDATRPGSIVGLHDRVYGSVTGTERIDRGPMIEAVHILLEQLSGRMQFVTVPELLKFGSPRLAYHYLAPPPELLAGLSEHTLVKRRENVCATTKY